MNKNLLKKTMLELDDLIEDLRMVKKLLDIGDAKSACTGYFDLGFVTSHGEIHPTEFVHGLCTLAEQQIEEEQLQTPQE